MGRHSVALAIGLAVLLTLGIIVLAVLPLGVKSFAGTLIHNGCPPPGNCILPGGTVAVQEFPWGSSVQLTWISVGGIAVQFAVQGVGECSESGVTGSCSFTSSGGDYTLEFQTSGVAGPAAVNFVGTYTAPLL